MRVANGESGFVPKSRLKRLKWHGNPGGKLAAPRFLRVADGVVLEPLEVLKNGRARNEPAFFKTLAENMIERARNEPRKNIFGSVLRD